MVRRSDLSPIIHVTSIASLNKYRMRTIAAAYTYLFWFVEYFLFYYVISGNYAYVTVNFHKNISCNIRVLLRVLMSGYIREFLNYSMLCGNFVYVNYYENIYFNFYTGMMLQTLVSCYIYEYVLALNPRVLEHDNLYILKFYILYNIINATYCIRCNVIKGILVKKNYIQWVLTFFIKMLEVLGQKIGFFTETC